MTEETLSQWASQFVEPGSRQIDESFSVPEVQPPTTEVDDEMREWANQFVEGGASIVAQDNLRLAEQFDPDASADIRQVSRDTGVPESAVAFNLESVKRAAKRAGPALLATQPAVATFVAAGLGIAKIVQDDINPLIFLENEAKRTWGNAVTSYEIGEQDIIINDLFDKKRESILAGTISNVDSTDLDRQIEEATRAPEHEGKFDTLERPDAHNPVELGVNAIARMIPLYRRLIVASARGAAVYGPSTFLLSGLNPLFAASGAFAGVTLEVAKEVYHFEAGAAFREFSQERDVNGDLQDPAIAAVGATAVGAINAALEVASLGYLVKQMKIIPGVRHGLNFFIKGAVKKAIATKSVRVILAAAVGRYIKATTFEAVTEALQEITTIAIGSLSKITSEAIEDTYFKDIDWATEFWPRIFEAFKEGGAAAGVMIFGPMFVRTTYMTAKAIKAQESSTHIKNIQDVHKAASETKIKERSPQDLEDFVGTLGLAEDAYISTDSVLFQELTEETSAVLEELGVTREEILDNASKGLDLKVETKKLHAKLSPEQFSLIEEDIKASPGAFSLKDLREFDIAMDVEIFSDLVQQEQVFNRQFQDEMTRLKKDAEKLGFGKQYAEDFVSLFERAANTFYPNIEDRVEFAKRVKGIKFFEGLSPTKAQFKDKSFVQKLKTLFQKTDEDVVQGATITEPATREHFVTLFQEKDASSLLHETGHIFMQEMGYVVERGLATEQLTKDYRAFKDWLGVKEDGKISTAQQEKFATAFEQYLFEGKAPSVDLIPTFQRFKNWLMTAFQKYAGQPPLTPEVKELFDRMFMTKQTVLEGAANNDMQAWSPEQMKAAKVIDEDKPYMERLERQMREEAETAMLKDMNTQLRELKPLWRKEALTLLAANRAYRTATFFREGAGISIQALEDAGYTKEAIEQLKKTRIAKKGGVTLLEAQTMSGYKTASEMVTALAKAPTKAGFLKSHVQVKTTEHIMEFKAEDYLSQTKSYASLLEIQDRYIKRSLGVPKAVRPTQVIKAAASVWLNKQSVRSATNVNRYLSEQAKWSRKQVSAVHAKDFGKASDAMDNARFNYELAKLAVKNKEKVLALEKTSRGLARRKIEGLEEKFRNAIYTLILDHNLPGAPRTSITDISFNVQDLLYAREENATRDPFPLDPEILSEGSYKDMSMSAANNLNDALKYLGIHGKPDAQKTLLTGERAGEKVGDVTPELAAESSTLRAKGMRPARTKLRKITDWSRKGYALVDSFNFIAGAMGGYVSILGKGIFSLVEKTTYLSLVKAQATEQRMFREFTDKTRPLFNQLQNTIEKLVKDFGQQMTHLNVSNPKIMRDFGQEGYWTPTQIIALAFHMGNESNSSRIFGGFPDLSPENLNTLVSVLKKEDWQAISDIGKLYDELFRRTGEVYHRLNGSEVPGISLPKVVTPFGEMDGWYAPIRYDKAMAQYAGDTNQISKIADLYEKSDLLAKFESKFRPTRVQANFMKSREARTPYPLDLTLSPFMDHIADSVHYIAFAETIEDVKNLVHSNDMKQATTRHLGADVYEGWKKNLQHIANPTRESANPFVDKIIAQSKRWGTAVILAYNTNVARKQVLSAFAAIPALGRAAFVKTYARAAIRSLAHPTRTKAQFDFMMESSPMMLNRASSFQQEFKRQLKLIDPEKFNFKLPLTDKRFTYDDIVDVGFFMIKAVDLATVMPLWEEAYNQELARTFDHEKAVTVADDLIRSTQPMSESMDLTRLQAEGGFQALLTMFSTFTIGKYQQRVRMNWRAWRNDKLTNAQYLERVFWEMAVPALAIAWLNESRYGDLEDETDWDTIWADAIQSAILLTAPAIGSIVGGLFSPYPMSLTPLQGAMRRFEFAVKGAVSAADRAIEGDVDAESFYAITEALGIFGRVPITNFVDTFPFKN